ncbi:MAG: sugar phosphate isomerase/epimerase [Clostridia bacterium]|nr:sugar phosphate isomerase/epimerase [Clostridia bacterium]
MELSVMSPVLNNMGLEEAVKYLSELGVDSMELGVGGYQGKALCDAADYLANPEKIDALKALHEKYNVKLSALACHGNPIHPNKEIAKSFEDDFNNAVLLAEKLGVETIIGFSGCPGDSENSKNPNWVTCAWPEDYLEILNWQWNEVLIPYWKKEAEFCAAHGIKKIAFEMHPGFMVYNPETLLKIRAAVGDIIGANFDPSHLFWQGIDPVEAIKYLGGAIHHFHAKDTRIDSVNTAVNGVLDTKNYGDILNRSWVFRTVGYGHGKEVWNNIISTLKAVGYDGAISIEHEDGLMSPKEGLEKAVSFLKEVLIYEKAGEMWWA